MSRFCTNCGDISSKKLCDTCQILSKQQLSYERKQKSMLRKINKKQKELDVERRAKAVSKAKEANKTIKDSLKIVSNKTLDDLFRKLVHKCYTSFCHGTCYATCGKEMRSGLQACHYVSRNNEFLRWHIANVLPGCLNCNYYTQSHVAYLGYHIDNYFGEDTASNLDRFNKLNHNAKVDRVTRNELKGLLTHCLSLDIPMEQLRNLYYSKYLKIITAIPNIKNTEYLKIK